MEFLIRWTRGLGFFFLTLGVWNQSYAQVSPENGNFAESFTVPSAEGPLMVLYNSKSSSYLPSAPKSLFGKGWGIRYESWIEVLADGSIKLHEYGSGLENRFSLPGNQSTGVANRINFLVKHQRDNGRVSSKDFDKLAKRYQDNLDDFNHDYAACTKELKNPCPKINVPLNTKLVSHITPDLSMVATEKGYILINDVGTKTIYNLDGFPVLFDYGEEYITKAVYQNSRLLQFVNQTTHQVTKFYYDDKTGQVSVMESDNRAARFTYDAQGYLESVQVVEKNGELRKKSFKYDQKGRLSEIYSGGKLTAEIEYDSTPFSRVKLLKEVASASESGRDKKGTIITSYSWKGGTKPGETTQAIAQVKLHDDKGLPVKSTVTMTTEFEPRNGVLGEFYIKRQTETQEIEGKPQEKTISQTTYNEDSQPVEQSFNKGSNKPEITSLTYDKNRRVIKKISPTEITFLTYDSKLGLINTLKMFDPSDRKFTEPTYELVYRYNEAGKLTYAADAGSKNSPKRIELFYNTQGKLFALNNTKHKLELEYGSGSRPLSIKVDKLGTLKIEYDNDMQIKNVITVDPKIQDELKSYLEEVMSDLNGLLLPAGMSVSIL